jgi:hypothetical protein
VSLALLCGVPFALFFLCCSGLLLLRREYTLYHVMLDEDQVSVRYAQQQKRVRYKRHPQIEVGRWIRENTSPKAVFLHKDIHITPSGSLAGRPTLIAYNGWMWSHGYASYITR